jgi:DNA-binding LytR/AlgR family response regulator
MTPTALIAEDEPLLAAGLQSDLARAWPELQVVAVAGDGDRAIAEALRLRPAICFLDIRMPGASGIEVAQALAEDWPEGLPPPLPVFVTAYEEHALQAFEAGAADYLLKPVEAARLASCVRRLRDSRRSRPSPPPRRSSARSRSCARCSRPRPRRRPGPRCGSSRPRWAPRSA